MEQNISDFRKAVTFHVCPGTISLDSPAVPGAQNNVIIAKTAHTDTIVKFNALPVIEKNVVVSKIYNRHGIPVPDIHMAKYNGVCVEVYPMIQGQTLREYIDAGASKSKIREAYNEIIKQFVKMDRIKTTALNDLKARTPARTVYYHKKNIYGSLVAGMTGGVFGLMNLGAASEHGLYHYDISPKNVIVTPDGQFKSFIDLDSVTICDRNFALAGLGTRWRNQGYDIKEMLDMVEELSHRKTDRLRIKTLAYINTKGKYFFWLAGALMKTK